ncbi:MAG TPA: hypothetical protein DEO86_18925 [Colwellia sp.]|mgnify:FL=1|nr:hypothetical protein [Colwellia sp.]
MTFHFLHVPSNTVVKGSKGIPMKFKFLNTAITSIILSVSALTNVASAGLITLDTSNVIGSTTPYDSRFFAENILDNQTGVITENNQNPSDAEGGYWLNPNNGTADAWITIDLGQAYVIDFMELFNTHNAQYFDRGTGDFRILASNSVMLSGSMGFDLAGTESVLIDSTLLAESGAQSDPLTAQNFAVSNTNAFRYIQFNADSVAVGGSACCGTNVYGLNEIRVSAVEVPEPSTLAIFALGMIGFASRRFKK